MSAFQENLTQLSGKVHVFDVIYLLIVYVNVAKKDYEYSINFIVLIHKIYTYSFNKTKQKHSLSKAN